jgi:hypothetical protein
MAKRILFTLTVALCLHVGALAQINYMTIAPGNWHNPAIWSTGTVPDVDDDTNEIIIGHAVSVTVDVLSMMAGLKIETGIVFTVDSAVTFECLSSGFRIDGTLRVKGLFYVSVDSAQGPIGTAGSTILIESGGKIENGGDCTTAGSLLIGQNGCFDNQGTATVGGLFTNHGDYRQNGTLKLDSTGLNTGVFSNSGNVWCNGNLFTLAQGSYCINSGIFHVAAQDTFINNTVVDTMGHFKVNGVFINNGSGNDGLVFVYGIFLNRGILTAGGFTIHTSGILDNADTASQNGSFNNILGQYQNHGQVLNCNATVASGGLFNHLLGASYTNGSLSVAGTFQNYDTVQANVRVLSGGNFNNNTGTLCDTESYGQLLIRGTFNNNAVAKGQLFLDTTGVLRNNGAATYNFASSTATINGTFSRSGTDLLQNMNIIRGSGTVNGNLPVATGHYVGDASTTGIFTVNGQYTTEAGRIFYVNINGPAVGTGFDRLVVNGAARIGGRLTVSIGFTPTSNTQFTILQSTGLTGTFSQILPALPTGWSVAYNTPAIGDVTLLFTAPVPVTLLHFKATPVGKQVQLGWATAHELNNAYFDIEHSINGTAFVPVGRILGRGNSNATVQYAFDHTQPAAGTNYYRLRQVDADGKYSFSATVSVKIAAQTLSIKWVNKGLTIEGLTKTGQLLVTDIAGRQLMFKTIAANGNAPVRVSVSLVSTGMYVVTLFTPNGIVTERVWRQ